MTAPLQIDVVSDVVCPWCFIGKSRLEQALELRPDISVEINWQDKSPSGVLVSSVLTGSDLKAVNNFEAPQRVVPQNIDKPTTTGGRTRLEVPAHSYTVIQWAG